MIILDVRSPQEFAVQHIDGAINFDVELMLQGKIPEVNKDEEIITYCRSGSRSGVAQQILKQHGYQNVTNGGGVLEMAGQGHNLI